MPTRIFYFLVFLFVAAVLQTQAQNKKLLADAEHYFSVPPEKLSREEVEALR